MDPALWRVTDAAVDKLIYWLMLRTTPPEYWAEIIRAHAETNRYRR